MKRLSSSIALLGAFLALSITACDNDTGPEPGVESITVTPAEVTMSVGDVVNLSATVETAGDASSDVTWSSSNSAVATVDGNGVVTGVSEGTATVTATAVADNSKKASATIQVTAPDPAQISITEYRAVSTGESDDDGPVPSPDTVGTACCSDQGSFFDNFLMPGQFAILEMDVEIDAAGRDVQRVEMLMNGEVVDFQEVTSTGGKAAGSNVLTYTLSKNTLDFEGGNDPKQGGVVDPQIPNGETTVAARVKFGNGETKTVTLGSKVIVKNHQQVIFFDKELPPSELEDDDPDTSFDEEGIRWWGGPDSQASFGITVVDHQDVGASRIRVANVCGTFGPGFDQGAGHGNMVEVTEDTGFMWTLTSEANSRDDDEGNKGVSGFYCPVPDRIWDESGEAWFWDGIMLSTAYTQELAFPHPKIPEGLSSIGFLALDWRAPVCEGDIGVRQSDGTFHLATSDRWFNTGVFEAEFQSDGGFFGIGSVSEQFDTFRPADAPTETFEDVEGPAEHVERTTDLGVELAFQEDKLGNRNDDPECGPTSEFGVDHGEPVFDDVLPDPADGLLVLKAHEDSLPFMPMFEVEDDTLVTGDDGSGVDFPATEIAILDAAGDPITGSPFTEASTEVDSDTDGDGTKGDYSFDLVELAGEGGPYSVTVTAPDLAIFPNVATLSFAGIAVDGTDPSVTRIDPPQTTTESSDDQLIFTIQGEVEDAFGLSEVLITVRDPGTGDTCELTDALVDEGTDPGEVSDNTIDVTDEVTAASPRFEPHEITVQNAGSGTTQHLCFFIEASDNAAMYDGTLVPHTSSAFTHTDIDWL